jgi:outer membrane protein assembly factor BamE (lipoprotein component of BamABCDE complex)
MKFTYVPLAAIGLAIACTPVINERGYLGDPQIESSLKTGNDTKTTVQKVLGAPSTTATFGQDSWYYISSLEKQVAFFTPTVENRTILAIYFDKTSKVTAIRHYSLKDGHVVAFETLETPAPGRELPFLQQLLNSTPASGASQEAAEPTPGGGIP